MAGFIINSATSIGLLSLSVLSGIQVLSFDNASIMESKWVL